MKNMIITTQCNSFYSVKDINKGAVPWLVVDFYSDDSQFISAGTSFAEFCNIMAENNIIVSMKK
jgi:hypothetical protein